MQLSVQSAVPVHGFVAPPPTAPRSDALRRIRDSRLSVSFEAFFLFMGSSFESGESTPPSLVRSTRREIRRAVPGEPFSVLRRHERLFRERSPGSVHRFFSSADLRIVTENRRNEALHPFAVASTQCTVA